MKLIIENGFLMLFLAIIFEILGTFSMKLSSGFTNLLPSISMIIFYITSLIFLNYTLLTIEVSIAYAIWSGAGTAIIAVIGIYYFNEPISVVKTLSILAIIAGVVGLNIA